ncbi:uncharacterized protein LOC122806973 isoform X2 [Protopterus annectens]|uniref:uncharacterized protein LOC122806973 isoform X2 n=1 Tax=Protopterus annectens TaxID=7888 RepID=UPI001CFB0C74|nr:uncharacterized protein LOC122806973 isoform X2 [Protopterus annectens]
MDISKIKWSSKDYNLKELVTKFQDSFPLYIKITEGFLGKQEVDSISSSTVLRIHCLYSQERAIAETKSGRILSVPTKSTTLRFFPVGDQQTSTAVNKMVLQKLASGTMSKPLPVVPPPVKPQTLHGILSKRKLPVVVRPANLVIFKVTNNPRAEEHRVDHLTISLTYHQEFILGHSITNEGSLIARCPVLLPMYMKQIKLVIAEGCEDGNEEKWKTLLSQHKNMISKLGDMEQFVFQDITLLDRKDIEQHGNLYSDVEPLYLDLTQQKYDIPVSLDEYCSQLPVSSAVSYDLPPLPIKKPAIKVPKLPDHPEKIPKKLTNVNDIPEDLHTLDTEGLCDCLILLNMEKYTDNFRKEQIDGHLLFDLEKDMMRICLGMNELHISKLLRFRSGWRPTV